jgi:hypothetical protein
MLANKRTCQVSTVLYQAPKIHGMNQTRTSGNAPSHTQLRAVRTERTQNHRGHGWACSEISVVTLYYGGDSRALRAVK